MFELYRKNKIILTAIYWEDLVSFVEILKKYNKNFVNRKDFKIKRKNKLIYKWNRR